MNKLTGAVIALLFFLSANFGFAQSRRTSPDERVGHLQGQLTIYPSPAFSPRDLNSLVHAADLIVEGHVVSALPRYRIANKPVTLETDIEILVTRVFKGARGRDIRRVIVTQMGGKIGDFELIVPNDPLMQLGEKYILFLGYDNRPTLPDFQALRCGVKGIWNGMFKIENHKIIPRPNSIFKRTQDQRDVDEFVADFIRVVRE